MSEIKSLEQNSLWVNDPEQKRAVRRQWVGKTKERLEDLIAVVESQREDWPRTLRGYFYLLVAAGKIENTKYSYDACKGDLTSARLQGHIPFEAVIDESYHFTKCWGYDDVEHFIQNERSNFLTGYTRDVMQGQPVVPEIWCEKNTLLQLLRPIADKYKITVVASGGSSSIDALYRLIERHKDSNQAVHLLWLTDHDPTGLSIYDSAMYTLTDEMEHEFEITGERIGITLSQVENYTLVENLTEAKKTDSRYKRFVEKNGPQTYELDALTAENLRSICENGVLSTIDTAGYEEQAEQETADSEEIRAKREKTESFLDTL